MGKPNRILLIDADVLAYEAASACEKAVEYEPGYWTWYCDFNEVVDTFDASVAKIKETLKGDEVKLCLTDSEGNFRKRILPTYKGKRSSIKKPLVLKPFKEFLIEKRGAYFRPGLEGDDCLGILATWPKLEGEKIIVSVDKDMKSVPGKIARWPSKAITTVTREEADRFHLFQTLTGDQTDGYSGCPGIGPKKAEGILNAVPVEEAWPLVVTAFNKAGLSEEEALVQARVARILRAEDYDFQRKEPILWQPPSAARSK